MVLLNENEIKETNFPLRFRGQCCDVTSEKVRNLAVKALLETGNEAPTNYITPVYAKSIPGIFSVPLHMLFVQDSVSVGGFRIPCFVEEICKEIEKKSNEVGVLRIPGNKSRMDELVDTIKSFEHYCLEGVSVNDLVGVFKYFLRQLPQYLVPSETLDCMLSVLFPEKKERKLRKRSTDKQRKKKKGIKIKYPNLNNDEILNLMLLSMPIAEHCLLIYTVRFLAKLAKKSDITKMSAKSIAIAISPSIFKEEAADINSRAVSRASDLTSLLEYLIEKAPSLGHIPPFMEEKLKGYNPAEDNDKRIAILPINRSDRKTYLTTRARSNSNSSWINKSLFSPSTESNPIKENKKPIKNNSYRANPAESKRIFIDVCGNNDEFLQQHRNNVNMQTNTKHSTNTKHDIPAPANPPTLQRRKSFQINLPKLTRTGSFGLKLGRSKSFSSTK